MWTKAKIQPSFDEKSHRTLSALILSHMVEVLEEIPTEKNTEKSTEDRHIYARKS